MEYEVLPILCLFLPHSPMSDGECEKFPIKGTEKNEIITFTGEFDKKLDLYRHSPLTLGIVHNHR